MSYGCSLITVTSSTCNYCEIWKNNHKNYLGTALKGNVTTIYYNIIPTEFSTIPKELHPEIGRFIEWYPTFILVPTVNFNNHDHPLMAKVYKGIENKDGKIEEDDSLRSEKITWENVLAWVKKTYAKLTDNYDDYLDSRSRAKLRLRGPLESSGKLHIVDDSPPKKTQSSIKVVPCDYRRLYRGNY